MARRSRKRDAKRGVHARPTRSARRKSRVIPSVPKRLHNLPTQLTTFIGREREIAEIKRLLGTTRLLTLTGIGGCGKTRLALQVAPDLLDDYADGVWFVDFAALTNPVLVPTVLATALNVPEQVGRSISDTLADSLHGKSLLLMLDNCEHLIEGCAELADLLVRSCVRVRILATSREPLGIPGETLWQVPPLSAPDPSRPSPLDQLTRYEAVRLFVERAGSRQSDFALTERNAAAVARICARLDGIPLAIELAATRVKGLTPEQIATRLDDRFRLLTGGGRTRLPRYQTLKAAMDWSYELLTLQERTALCRLAVFAGGFTLEAAEAVCAGDGVVSTDVLDVLMRLVDKSLVTRLRSQDESWYRLLETVREYASEQLRRAGETERIRRRHRDWYVSLAKEAAAELHGPEQIRWLNRLEAEHDNLRAALEASRGESATLAAALSWFWYIHGHYREGRGRLEEVLKADDLSSATRTQVCSAIVPFISLLGEVDRAVEIAETGLQLSRAIGNRETEASLLLNLASAMLLQEDYARAEVLGHEAVEAASAIGSQWLHVRAISFLAHAAQVQGHLDAAAAGFSQSRAMAETIGDKRSVALAIGNLGFVAMDRGDSMQAAAYYAEALRRTRDLRDPWMTAQLFWAIARIAFMQEQYQRAACLFGVAEASREATGYRRTPYARPRYEEGLAGTRAALGEAVFDAHWADGLNMTVEHAIDYAIATAGAIVSKPSAKMQGLARRAPELLTRREREVAIFVAQGLSNRDIAGRLVISERTAEAHIQNILNKLGADSRTYIATWAVRHGLVQAPTD